MADEPVAFWVSQESSRDVPIDGVRTLPPGAFVVSFAIPVAPLVLSVNVRYAPGEKRLATKIIVSAVERIPGNEFEVLAGPDVSPQTLHLSGTTIPADQAVALWIASPSNPSVPVSSKTLVGPARFEATLELPAQAGSYMLVMASAIPNEQSAPEIVDDTKGGIEIVDYAFVNGKESPMKVVHAIDVERLQAKAYQRVFRVKAGGVAVKDAAVGAPARVELPLAYSPFMEISQRERPLKSVPDFRGLTEIVTADLDAPFVANYRMPALVWFMTIVGAVVSMLGCLSLRSQAKSPRETIHRQLLSAGFARNPQFLPPCDDFVK
jgi:hypothetical protein